MMLLRGGDTHVFFEPLEKLRQKAHDGEFAEMLMVAQATNSIAIFERDLMNDEAEEYIITAGIPRTSPGQDKMVLFRENAEILAPIMEQIPKDAEVWIATNPPIPLCGKFRAWKPRQLRTCTDNLRHEVWGNDATEANNRMLTAKGYTSYGPAAAIAREVLGL